MAMTYLYILTDNTKWIYFFFAQNDVTYITDLFFKTANTECQLHLSHN
jgi:hypothetical protein